MSKVPMKYIKKTKSRLPIHLCFVIVIFNEHFLLLKVNFRHIYVTHLTLFPADPPVLSDNSTCDTSCQDSHLLVQSVPHNETLLSQKSDLNPYFKREKEGTRILHVFRCNEWVTSDVIN